MRKSNDPLMMKIHKHKSSHKDSDRKSITKHLFSPAKKDHKSPNKDGPACGEVHIGAGSAGSGALHDDLDRSFKRSFMAMSEGRIKSSCSLDKLNRKSSVIYDTLSSGNKTKLNKKGDEEVDASYQMLIEQYQQSNALLAQNINTLLYLNQQAASGGKSSSSNTITVTSNTVSKHCAPLTTSLSKQVLNQVKNEITCAYNSSVKVTSTITSTAGEAITKQLNGIISSSVFSLKSDDTANIINGEDFPSQPHLQDDEQSVSNNKSTLELATDSTSISNCMSPTKGDYTSVAERSKHCSLKETNISVPERNSGKKSLSKELEIMTTTAFPLSLCMPKSYMAKIQTHKRDKMYKQSSSNKNRRNGVEQGGD
jgi:hypothetical protein